jgi:hypothetical protein
MPGLRLPAPGFLLRSIYIRISIPSNDLQLYDEGLMAR